MTNKMKLYFTLTFMTLIASTGCSLFSHKAETQKAPSSNEVIDAGFTSANGVKVKESQTIDAGVYHEREDSSDISLYGGKNGSTIPTEKFYSFDREKYAPLGRMLYVLTDDSPAHCIMGKYVSLEGRKKLIVYSKTVLPTNYCIYQKQFSTEAQGFSLYINDGGRCKPSFTVVNEDDQKRKTASVEEVDHTISMSYCVDNTISYGQEIARRKSEN